MIHTDTTTQQPSTSFSFLLDNCAIKQQPYNRKAFYSHKNDFLINCEQLIFIPCSGEVDINQFELFYEELGTISPTSIQNVGIIFCEQSEEAKYYSFLNNKFLHKNNTKACYIHILSEKNEKYNMSLCINSIALFAGHNQFQDFIITTPTSGLSTSGLEVSSNDFFRVGGFDPELRFDSIKEEKDFFMSKLGRIAEHPTSDSCKYKKIFLSLSENEKIKFLNYKSNKLKLQL